MTDNKEHTFMLFKYLRNHEDEKFKELINKNSDVNVKDKLNKSFLTYAVDFNKIDIVTLLLENGANYDIVDDYGRSILYGAIESNFYEIVSILLLYSSKNIGKMITDIRDINGNIPLHYAIVKQNNEITKLLLDAKSNPYIINKDGHNSLHIAVHSGTDITIKYILDIMPSIDIKTLNGGETSLHIATNYNKILIVLNSFTVRFFPVAFIISFQRIWTLLNMRFLFSLF